MMHTSVDVNRLDAVMGQYGRMFRSPSPQGALEVTHDFFQPKQ